MQHLTLKQARKRRKLSVTALAQKSGVNKSTVSRIENGRVRPLHQTVEALREVLGVKFEVACR